MIKKQTKFRFGFTLGVFFLMYGILNLANYFLNNLAYDTLFVTIFYVFLGLLVLRKWKNLPQYLKWSFVFVAIYLFSSLTMYITGNIFSPQIQEMNHALTNTETRFLNLQIFLNKIFSFPLYTVYQATKKIDGAIVFIVPFWASIIQFLLNILWVSTWGALLEILYSRIRRSLMKVESMDARQDTN